MDVLPKWERYFYWVAGIGTFAYSQWAFFSTCQDEKRYMKYNNGWKLLGGKRDTLDYEWLCFQYCALKVVSLAAGHLVLSHALVRLKLNETMFKAFILLYDTLAFTYVFGGKVTVLFYVEILLMFAVCLQHFISVVWILGLVLTASLNYEWVEKWQVFEDWHTPYDKQLFYISNAYLHMRVMSAAVEVIKQRKFTRVNDNQNQNCVRRASLSPESDYIKKNKYSHIGTKEEENISLLDFICYAMYFPISIYGPMVTFDDFHPRRKAFFHSGGKICSMQKIAVSVFRIFFWLLFLEFAAHFMYPNSVSLNLIIVSKLSIPGMIGFIMWQALYFLMKYVCFFGIGSVACKIDGVAAPPLPRCVATLYRYTDTWKYFDAGYYNFIKKYIYIPLGGSQCGFYWQALASVAAFSFIYYWHGATYDIFLWATGNWSVIAVEMIVIQLLKSKRGSSLMSLLSPATILRIKAVLYVPCFVLSSVQIVCFFFSKDVAYIMADIMILSASWSAILLQIACFYFNLQNAIYITDVFHVRKRMVD